MGLQLLLSFLSFFLKTGTTSANFSLSGNITLSIQHYIFYTTLHFLYNITLSIQHYTLYTTIKVIRKKIRKNVAKLLNDFGRYVIR